MLRQTLARSCSEKTVVAWRLNMREREKKGFIAKLQSVTIKKLISISFGIMLVLILILGMLSIFFSRTISSQTEILYNRPHSNLVSMWSTKAKAADVGSKLLLGYAQNGVLTAEEKDVIATLGDQIRAIEANKVDKKAAMSEQMTAILAAEEAWSAKAKELSDMLDAGKADQITKNDIQEYKSSQDALTTGLDGIIKTASANALKFKENAATQANVSGIIMLAFFALAFIIVTVVLRIVIKNITEPMGHMVSIANEISRGNLNEPILYDKKTEFGELANCFRDMQNYLKRVVKDIEDVLDKMGKGNFKVQPQIEYIGNFAPVSESIHNISVNLSQLLGEISDSADLVSGGVNQLKQEAVGLSEGATDQSAAVEELTATIGDISNRVEQNAQGAVDASDKVSNIVNRITESNEQMQMVKEAIAEISEKSNEIGNIAQTIDSIATQTNLLSLNASIEAARAGEAGKGFAVVANEVKNLSEQSQEAVKNTAVLVESCIMAIEKGTKLTDETAKNLLQIVEDAKEITQVVGDISVASQTQSEAVSQINEGMEQISDVIQSNSSAADETAAASEKLSDLANSLKDLVDKFDF